jgi:hypothetical protein
MRRFMVHLVTEVEFEDGDEASDKTVQLGDRSERRPRALAPDSQGRPDRECLGRRNQNRALANRRFSA